MKMLLSTEQVANILGVSSRTVARMVHTGELVVAQTKRPRGFLFDPDRLRPRNAEPGPHQPPQAMTTITRREREPGSHIGRNDECLPAKADPTKDTLHP